MTSTDERLSADPFLTATADEVEQDIRRGLLKHGFITDTPDLINPDLIAAVMTVAGPVIEAKDAEITRLRLVVRSAAATAERVLGQRLKVLETNARASEQRLCADYLGSLGLADAADALRVRAGFPGCHRRSQ